MTEDDCNRRNGRRKRYCHKLEDAAPEDLGFCDRRKNIKVRGVGERAWAGLGWAGLGWAGLGWAGWGWAGRGGGQ